MLTTFDGRQILMQDAKGTLEDDASAPLVLVLHGAGGKPKGFARKVPVEIPGVVAIYPTGTIAAEGMEDYRVWNAGLCCGRPAAQKTDDVGYLARLIDSMRESGKLAQNAKVDLVGHSNGAMMALRFACERPELVSRVVTTAGALVSPCVSSRGVSFLLIHGTEDRAVPIKGGKSVNQHTSITFPSMEQTAERIRAGGGRVKTIVLPDAGHNVGTIDRALRKTRGKSLQDVTRDWLAGN